MAEAIYGPGKTPEEVASIVAELLEHSTGPVVLTRANDEQVKAARAIDADVEQRGSIVVWRPAARREGNVVVLTAGTADGPVADECAATLFAHGVEASVVRDVGVAGLHRLLSQLELIEAADVLIVVAGMEGALASVVTGLTAVPVVAVPTSTGYGAAFEGVTALLAMLSSCASGLSVVGIDNGFGAAAAAMRFLGPPR